MRGMDPRPPNTPDSYLGHRRAGVGTDKVGPEGHYSHRTAGSTVVNRL